jgi:hypothetical protein
MRPGNAPKAKSRAQKLDNVQFDMDAILAKSPSYGKTTNLSIVTNKLKQTNFGIHDTEDDVFTVDPEADNAMNTTLKALKDFRTP